MALQSPSAGVLGCLCARGEQSKRGGPSVPFLAPRKGDCFVFLLGHTHGFPVPRIQGM